MSQERKLTRRRVAREELDTAIELIFSGASIISANLLAWAAADVLRGVATAQGRETFFARVETVVRPEKLKEFRALLRDHYTYSKHAKEDPDRVVDNFSERAVQFVLIAAVEDYVMLYGQYTYQMMLFRTWYLKQNPDFLTEEGQRATAPATNALRVGSREEAFELLKLAKEDAAGLWALAPPEARRLIEL